MNIQDKIAALGPIVTVKEFEVDDGHGRVIDAVNADAYDSAIRERDLALEILRQFQFRAAITPQTKTAITAYHYWGPNPQDIESIFAACGKDGYLTKTDIIDKITTP